MKYFGTILGFCFIVYAAFAVYKYTPDAIKGAKYLAVGIFNLLEDATSSR